MNGAEKMKRVGAVRLWAGADGRETSLHPVSLSFCILLSLIQLLVYYKDSFHHRIETSLCQYSCFVESKECGCVTIMKSKLEAHT